VEIKISKSWSENAQMDGQLDTIIPPVPSKYYYCPNKLSLSRFSVRVTTMKPFWQLEGEHYLNQTTRCKRHRFTQNVIEITEIEIHGNGTRLFLHYLYAKKNEKQHKNWSGFFF